MHPIPLRRLSLSIHTALLAASALGFSAPTLADADALSRMPRTLVTASPDEDKVMQTPASLDIVTIDAADSARLGVNLSDTLQEVPGVTVRSLQNPAQDVQISIRGYGARSTFGVRGIRLYADDIPASMPDGSGQVAHFSLDAADRLEVLRGPFSALYGNSSGGVIALYSAPGTADPRWQTTLRAGSDSTWRAALNGRGLLGEELAYNLSLSRYAGEGWREHSKARRDSGNLRLDWSPRDGTRLTLIANSLNMPQTEDAGSLTWEEFRHNPRQASASALLFNTREPTTQTQGGLIFEQQLTDTQSLRLLGYRGTRTIEGYLSIPRGAQNSPLHSGGMVDLNTHLYGGDARWQFTGDLAGRPFALVAGLSSSTQAQTRRGFENFLGDVNGVRGRLRRNERNHIKGQDQYAQFDWHFAERWSLLAGARHSEITFRSQDHYINARNPDDSGSKRYSDTSPVAGLMFHASDTLNFYASHGRGFETPTFVELAYRTDGGAGLAFDLKPALSRNHEMGTKWQIHPDWALQAALFRADTDDEIAIARNSGGRTSYRNVASARRQGAELAVDGRLSESLSLRLAYTRVEGHFQSPFLACVTRPCLTPDTLISAGSPIPGIPRSQVFARLGWEQEDWRAGVDAFRVGKTPVDDAGSEISPDYTLYGIEASRDFGPLRLFARIDNLLDRTHVSSVSVNDFGGAFYEPGAGRQWSLGAQWTF